MTLTYISRSSDFYTFYINVPYLLNYKAYNHQTLYSASPQCTDLAGSLTWQGSILALANLLNAG